MTISVVIPVYNGAAHLSEALESVLNQTRPPDEILVIDDGSTDDSASIALRYKLVRVIRQANSGVSETRNRGIRESAGDWIAFLDQDDVWEKEKLAKQEAAILGSPHTDVCLTGQRYLSQRNSSDNYDLGPVILPPPSGKVSSQLYGKLRFVPSCVIARKAALLDVNGFRQSASPCEDWDLWLRMEQAGAVFTTCLEPLLRYRFHSQNTSNNGQKMFEGELRVMEQVILPREKPVMRQLRRLRLTSQFLAGLALMDRSQNRPHRLFMFRSLLYWPFGFLDRYRIMLHMLLHGHSSR